MMNKNNNNGFILVSLLAAVLFTMIIGIVTSQLVISNLKVANSDRYRLKAQLAADAAVDHALQEINQSPSWTGTSGQLTLYEDSKVKTTYESSITPGADDFEKILSVTGRTFVPKDSATAHSTRSYQVDLRGIGGGNYSIVTGVGGLTMRNNARILDGNVFVNGTLSMSNFSQIGLTISPVSVQVAHQSCPSPADSTFPTQCNFGENGEPISFLNNASIYGDVKATNQQNGSNMYSPGLTSACYPPSPSGCVNPINLPGHDRDAQKAAINPANDMTGSAAGCSFGTKNWPANTKITGDVIISNTCDVIIEGDVWITGNIEMRNLGSIKVAEGLTDAPVIMIDGSSGLSMFNASALLPNTTYVGTRVVTYYSLASCSPDCPSVTGVDLFNSSSVATIHLNNAAAGGFTEFYARWTKLEAGNSGNIGAVVAQEIELSNAIAITFGASVSGLNQPSGWVIKNYKRVFN